MNSEVSILVSLNYKFHYIFFSVDHTRVKLKDVDPNVPGAEYVNANYIKVICTVVIRAVSCTLPWLVIIGVLVECMLNISISRGMFSQTNCCFLVIARGGTVPRWTPQILHCNTRLSSKHYVRLLGHGLAGEYSCHCHDHQGDWARQGMN